MIGYVALFLEALRDAVGELFVKSGAGTTIASELATALPQGEAHSLPIEKDANARTHQGRVGSASWH